MPTSQQAFDIIERIEQIKDRRWKRKRERQELEDEALKKAFAKQVLSEGQYARYLLTGEVPEETDWDVSSMVSPEAMQPVNRIDFSSITPQLGQRPKVEGLKNFQLKGNLSIPLLPAQRPGIGYEQIMTGAGEDQSKRIQRALEYYGKAGIKNESDLNEIAQRIAGMRGVIPVEDKPTPEKISAEDREWQITNKPITQWTAQEKSWMSSRGYDIKTGLKKETIRAIDYTKHPQYKEMKNRVFEEYLNKHDLKEKDLTMDDWTKIAQETIDRLRMLGEYQQSEFGEY